MIVVVGRVKTDGARREELLRVGQAVAAASRTEQGCLSYRLYEDTEADNEFLFVEEWESQEALEGHFGTSHIAEFMQAVPATLTDAPDVSFHTVASTVDLAQLRAST